jgi:hypothetical protein
MLRTRICESAVPRRLSARLIGIDVEDSLSEVPRCFLWQIVADTARDCPVRIFPGELVSIGCGIRVRCAIGVTFKGYRGDGNDGKRCQSLFQIVILGLAFGEAQAPAIIMDDNRDVVRVVERLMASCSLPGCRSDSR